MLTFFSVCFIQILFSEYCCEMASVTRHHRHLLLVRYYWGIQQMMLIRQSHKRAKVSQAIRFSCQNVPLFVSLFIRFVVIFMEFCHHLILIFSNETDHKSHETGRWCFFLRHSEKLIIEKITLQMREEFNWQVVNCEIITNPKCDSI